MASFLGLFSSIVPLYFCIFLGSFSSKFLKCDKKTIANILFYILSPLVIFNATISINFSFEILLIPVLPYLASVFIAFTSLIILQRIYKDNRANLLAFSTAVGNSAYLGIPLALIFLDENLVEIFIFAIFAVILYQNSAGYFIVARSTYSFKESLLKILKLPSIHAFLIAIILNISSFKMPDSISSIFLYAKGTLSILGMMIIGMGLEKIRLSSFEFKFIGIAIFIKFLIHPFIMCFLIYLDSTFFHIYELKYYIIFFILSIVPIASDSIIVTSVLNLNTEKISLLVFITSLISLFTIPLMMIFYENFKGFL
ncbi:transporter [Campylobacter sp. LR291e]|uniref:AEC family transporter n=1 Tax=Campylobacter sp. LR291e TaxID=2593546 RepID=UPI00123B699D|nr:transporter [Campylobacter sp. LR291e]KAA6234302.1 transporter [Campylobacter sp. LR291e]